MAALLLTEALAKIKKHPLFLHLDSQWQAQVLASVREFHYPSEAQIIQQGQSAAYFYFVLSGRVKLYRISSDGQEKVVEVIHPNQTFAEAVMFMQRSEYPVYAESLEAVHLLSIPNALMLQALASNPQACLQLLGHFSMRLHLRLGEIEMLTLQNATQRFALYLIQQIENRALDDVHIDLMLPKQLIASRLSMKPETLSRIIAKLRDDGLLNIQGRHIHIPSVDALLNLFNESEVQTVRLR